MTESWRRKRYYQPRILINTQDVLNSDFPDGILCLTGGQLNIVRNLLGYATRRANWVTTYETDTYLTPTDEEWDNLQAIVADLQEQAMNTCTELWEQLEAILAMAACACESAGSGYGSPLTGPIYQDLVEAETLVWTPPDGTPTPEEAAACDLAQLVYAWNMEFLTEDLQPIETALHEVLLYAVLQTIATALGGPVGAVSAPGIYYIVTKALNAWVEGELAGVVNELTALKDELTCAMYQVFLAEESYNAAATAAAAVIDASTQWSPVDKLLFKATFSPLVMAICQSALTAESDWAAANVDEGWCADCPGPPFSGVIRVESPPCPGDWDYLQGGCNDTHPTWGNVPYLYYTATDIRTAWIPIPAGNWKIDLEAHFRSGKAANFDCGYHRLYRAILEDKSDSSLQRNTVAKSGGPTVDVLGEYDWGSDVYWPEDGWVKYEFRTTGPNGAFWLHYIEITMDEM